jgi:hypothetical protein
MTKYSAEIKRVYTRHYTDNDTWRAYVEWADGSRTEGQAIEHKGDVLPTSLHMSNIFDRARRQGLTVEHQTW